VTLTSQRGFQKPQTSPGDLLAEYFECEHTLKARAATRHRVQLRRDIRESRLWSRPHSVNVDNLRGSHRSRTDGPTPVSKGALHLCSKRQASYPGLNRDYRRLSSRFSTQICPGCRTSHR
jgi:hypothetical protein